MTYLVRKFNRAKWPNENFSDTDINDLKADAITSCLRTSNNELSVWEINSKEEFHDVVVALAPNFDKLGKMDLIFFEKSKVEELGFTVKKSDGSTPIKRLVSKHSDISELNFRKIGEFSSLMLYTMENQENIKRVTEKKVMEAIIKELESGELLLTDLKESVVEKIRLLKSKALMKKTKE